MSAAEEPIIGIRDLRRSYPDGAGGTVDAVDGVTLDFAAGEVTAVLGPNGAGKTTLMDMILGLNTPNGGEIRVFGGAPRHAVGAGRVGALLQTGGLLPDLTVKETVQIIAALHRHSLPVGEVMETAGILEIADRPVGKCSGGQQQRLRFALALLPRPDLMILDEPTAGMDPSARHEFWDRMRRQADAGATVLFATHYLEEAEQFARRTVLMHRGRVIADGPTAEVQQRAGAAHVTVTWEASQTELEALPHVISHSTQGSRVTFRTDDADGLARHLLTATPAAHLSVRPASLEEAFMLLTGDPDSTAQDQRSTARGQYGAARGWHGTAQEATEGTHR